MGEIFIEADRLRALISTAAARTGIPAETLWEKVAPHLRDGGLPLPGQIGALLQDPARLEALFRSGVLQAVLRDMGGQKTP